MGQFLKFFGRRGRGESPKQSRRRQPHRRSLSIEPLEQRRLLAITVDTLTDEADGSIVDGDISLRDAIGQATPGETINFAPALTAGGAATLNLSLTSAIAIDKALTITGPGANLLTIDASTIDLTPNINNGDGRRIFNVAVALAGFQAVTIEGLTLTGADSVGLGGAIISSENLTLRNMVIRANAAAGGAGVGSNGPLSIFDSEIRDNISFTVGVNASAGGGIHLNVNSAGTFQIVRTTVSNNSATGRGGGIFAKTLAASSFRITDSAVLDNSATLNGGGVGMDTGGLIVTNSAIVHNNSIGAGGGIKATTGLTIDGSLIDNNTAFSGGGIHADAGTNVTIRTSTISNNTSSHDGGGVFVQNANSVWTQVTISGNKANSAGGGVYSTAPITIRHSTITLNRADADALNGETGGGIFFTNTAGTPVTIEHTILAGNLLGAVGATTINESSGRLAAAFSVVGIAEPSGLLFVNNGGNVLGTSTAPVDPLLATLAANDGPNLRGSYSLVTHSLLVGSPAIDAGDAAAIAGTGTTPILDERGTGFIRVYNSTGLTTPRIDIGALELQPSALVGDYNFDGIVSSADYTVWRNTLGSTTDKRADGNRDGAVNMDDFAAWKTHYGETLAMSAAGAASGGSLPLALTSSDDAAHTASTALSTAEEPAAGLSPKANLGLPGQVESVEPGVSGSQHNLSNSVPSQSDQALQAWLALSLNDAAANSTSSASGASLSLAIDDTVDDQTSLDIAFAGLGAGL